MDAIEKSMLKLTAFVSGNVQSVGYRAKVLDLAQSLNLSGVVQNLPDGRVKVIAEGEGGDLERLCRGLQMSNGLIDVEEIVASYSQPSGDYEGFVKLVSSGETDQRLDIGVQYIKELIDVTRSGFESMGNKIDGLGVKIDVVGGKVDRLGEKINCLGEKMNLMLSKQDETNQELRGFRADLKDHMDRRFDRIEEKLDRSLKSSPPKRD
ncbi:MAG: acylphosphatase [Methanotrichaceae archaeon]|nr:acylphosphatase [Methanotrichaceae archaeon]